MGENSGPGYAKHPDHRVELEPTSDHVTVSFEGAVIADTTDALRVNETGHPPAYYVPRRDVAMDRLVRTEHRSRCPFKGEASYFTVSGEHDAENAVWSYEAPFDEVLGLKDRLAFYPDKVTITIDRR